jgi:iron complex transport system ATP-binding protein
MTRPPYDPQKILDLSGVELRRGPNKLLTGIDWSIRPGQHWALLGQNGAGKTLILRLATGYIWPTEGQITVLGHRLGRVDLRQLRCQIGWVSQALADLMPGHVSVLETILSGPLASLGLYTDPSEEMISQARLQAAEYGLGNILDRPFGLLSSGERQRTLLARAALTQPKLLILDEPISNLDMGGREQFLNLVQQLASGPDSPTIILTTHSIQEIGPFITHLFLIKNGSPVTQGPIETVLTAENLTRAYDLPFKIEKTPKGRYLAYLE